MVDVRDADPLILELLRHLHAVAELFLQIFKIEAVQLLGGGVLQDGLMRGLFKDYEVGLPHHRRVDVVHAGGQNLAPHQRLLLLGQELVVHHHFGENRCRLGQGQG